MNTVMMKTSCLHEFFEMQADMRPDHPALICREEQLSYGHVEQRANQLARHLRDHDVGPGSLVALYFERSEKPIISVLATLKAGAGYVPIDPAFPKDRMQHILDESGASVIVSESVLSGGIPDTFDGSVVLIDGQAMEIAAHSSERVSLEETQVTPDDLTYVLYTSGTTGRPKGVMPEHRNVVEFVSSFNEVCEITPDDRVYQGFSLGFDGSVEEMWMAFSNGASLVVGTPEIIRLSHEVARLFKEQEVTVFSTVPTFLSMFEEDIPSLRLVIVSGEVCPPELVDRWARPGRRMLNVYGPTEATVNTTVAECQPGKPVTIGKPLKGYTTHILDERMQPVAPGTSGELYIGGVGIARGYFGQPELTRKQFVSNLFLGSDSREKFYRTGDLVSENVDGELEFHGRIDRQVKIRGYRIELTEIESVLREHPAIQMAVIDVFERDSIQQLAAYVVLREISAPWSRDSVLQFLRDRLPAYMIPGYLDVLVEVPTLASGKVDRKRLPEPEAPLVETERDIVMAVTELECQLKEAWEAVFRVSPISVEDDFFLDLGGYSLLAARMVSLMRKDCLVEVAIRDCYRFPTIRQLAEYLTERQEERAAADACETEQVKQPSSREVFESVPRWQRGLCYALQGVFLALFYGVASLPVATFILMILGLMKGLFALSTVIVTAAALMFLSYPALLASSIVLKWVVIGRYKAGRYPLWSIYYFRWWLATRFQAISGLGILSGTPVMSLYYRMMGAQVGKNCIIDTPQCTVYDLVNIGDDTSIGSQTQLLGYRVEDGMLVIGGVEIGSRCFVGTHCVIGLESRMEDDAVLDDLSLISDGEVISAGESRRGSPAEKSDVPLPQVTEEQASSRRPFLYGMCYFLLLGVLTTVMIATTLPTVALLLGAYSLGGIPWLILMILPAAPLSVITFCLLVAAIKKVILPCVEPGLYPIESWFFLRKWLVDTFIAVSRSYVHNLYTTIYLSPWLRMLGARIGKRAEISTVSQMTPDLTIIGDESFFADGSMVGGRRFFRGQVQLAENRIGRRSFVGNNAMLPAGASLGDGCLLGCLSTPPGGVGATTRDGTEWLGSPSFELPYRQKVGGFEIHETYEPGRKLYIQRYLIDAVRILLPNLIGISALLLFVAYIVVAFDVLSVPGILLSLPVAGLTLALLTALSVVAVKKVLMGTFEPVFKPLWSVYVWWNEVVNGVYETVGSPILAPMLGTPFYAWYLRLLGCRVGKHVYLETSLFSEFDLVEIGDYAALNSGVVIQNHLFEDRVMKSSRLKIGDECSVGNLSVVLYDTEMQSGSVIGPLSLLMKGETLPPSTRWEGIPTRQTH